MLRARRRSAALLVLFSLSLSACHRVSTVEGPVPGQRIAGLVMNDGRKIDFPSPYRGAVEEDSLVVVRRLRDASFVESYPAADVDQVVIRELDKGRTFGLVALAGLGFLLFMSVLISDFDDGYDGMLGGSTSGVQ